MSVVEVPQTETEVPTTYSEILTDAEGQEFTYECTPDLETGELIEVAESAATSRLNAWHTSSL